MSPRGPRCEPGPKYSHASIGLRPRTLSWAVLGALLLALTALAPVSSAQAALAFTASAANADKTTTTQAGAHPHALSFDLELDPGSDGALRELRLSLPPGLLINPSGSVATECSAAGFATPRNSPFEASQSGESCPNAAQLGTVAVEVGGSTRHFGLFNLVAPQGVVAAFGASPFGTPLIFTVRLREEDYGLDILLGELPQSFDLRRLELELWGTPWLGGPGAASHDQARGNCLNEQTGGSWGECKVFGAAPAPPSTIKSLLTMPTTPCGSPLAHAAKARSWQGAEATATASTPALVKCNKALSVPAVQLMTDAAASRTGLAFNLAVNDGGGITNPGGIARPAIKKAVIALPEGLTINPSLAAGLGTCAPAEFARETATSPEGSGCPNSSKIGTVGVEGVLGLPEPLLGAVYLARPHENPFGSLIGVYIVARSERRGLIVRSFGELRPDPASGRLTATFDELPRLLYTHFSLTLREGQRSTLVSPPTCGAYPTQVEMASYAEPTVFTRTSSTFFINRGNAGACPGGGLQPFAPGLLAGSLNPSPATYTPFHLRMTRTDAEQEITSYSATLPPGLLGRLAGIPDCPEAAIAAARSRSGAAELAAPSCPAASQIGHTLAGYGVGGVLAWAPGNLFLAGPYRGAPLSVVAIDSALIGPFDLGVVVVRSAIRIDPRTAQVSIDSAGSDPIPHMLAGIPLHLRDIRVFVDRPGFTVTPTSCDPSQVVSRLTGAGANLGSAADDPAAETAQRYQLLGCGPLRFRPKLKLRLAGGTPRYPGLRAELRARPGEANLATVAVTMPATQFLAQSHLRDLCTRPQFEADRCPPDSVYGRARVFTPLLEEPLEGPVYLRTANPLPDLVFALRGRGGIRIDVVGDIDTVHGGLRTTFTGLPDAPLEKFVLNLAGAGKGLLETQQGACRTKQFAHARLIGHNNLGEALVPRVKQQCAKRRGSGGGGRR